MSDNVEDRTRIDKWLWAGAPDSACEAGGGKAREGRPEVMFA